VGKPNVIVTVGRGEDRPAEHYIRRIFRSNFMAEPVGVLKAEAVGPCYTCGFGANCTAGSVVARHGFLKEICRDHINPISTETYQNAQIIAKRLGAIIRKNKIRSE
jgi:hypothetical protein